MEELLKFVEDNTILIAAVVLVVFGVIAIIIGISIKKAKKNKNKSQPIETVESEKVDFATDKIVNVKPKTIEKPKAEVVVEEIVPEEVVEVVEEEDINAIRKKSGFVVIYKDKSGTFRLRVIASNKLTIAHSLGHPTVNLAKRKLQQIVRSANSEIVDTIKGQVSKASTVRYELYLDKEEKYRFRLIDKEEKVLLASQGYTTKQNCLNGIVSLQYVLRNHTVQDTTKE